MSEAKELFDNLTDIHTRISVGAYASKDIVEECFKEKNINEIKLKLFMMIARLDGIVNNIFEANHKAWEIVASASKSQ